MDYEVNFGNSQNSLGLPLEDIDERTLQTVRCYAVQGQTPIPCQVNENVSSPFAMFDEVRCSIEVTYVVDSGEAGCSSGY